MLLLTKIIGIQLAWIGCILVYASSKRQVLFDRSPGKGIAWAGFAVAQLASGVLLGQIYHPLTAGLFVLGLVMLAWIIIALWSPHCPRSHVVLSSGTLLMLGVALLGGVHVV